MAQVPEVESPSVLPAIEGISTRANPQQAGAQVGQAVQKLGAATEKTAEFYGQVAANDALNKAQAEKDKVLYGTGEMQPNPNGDGTMIYKGGFFSLSGADAMNALPGVNSQLDEIDRNAQAQLWTMDSKQRYQEESRRYRFYANRQIGEFSDQQYKKYQIDTAETTARQAIASAAQDPSNPNLAARSLEQARSAYVQSAQAKGDTDAQGATLKADQDVTTARIKSMLGRGDSAGAQTLFNANIDTLSSMPGFDALGNQVLESVINDQSALMARQAPGTAGAAASMGQVSNSIGWTEYHGKGPPPDSLKGAIGPSQIKPATARQYGLDPTRLKDPVYAKFARDTLLQKFSENPKIGNDPARLAVAYFSGERNVAPIGSKTPYIRNTNDGHFTVQQYVDNVTGHLKGGGAPQTPADTPEYLASVRARAAELFPQSPADQEKLVRATQENIRRDDQFRTQGTEAEIKDQIDYAGRPGSDPAKVTWTPDKIRASVPGAQGEAMAAEMEESLKYSKAAQTIATMPEDKVEGFVSGFAPQGPEEFKDKEITYEALQRAAADRETAIYGSPDGKKPGDPAAYVRENFPDVAEAYQKATTTSDPRAFQDYERRLNAAYGALGVPAQLRAILPRDKAKAIAMSLASMSPYDAQKGLDGIKKQAGDQWQQVYRDLGRAGLPMSLQALQVVGFQAQKQMLAAMSYDPDTRKKGGKPLADELKGAVGRDGKSVVETIDHTISTDPALGSLNESIARVAGPRSLDQIDGLHDLIRQTAMYLYVEGGGKLTAQDAASRAAAMVTDEFSFIPQGDHPPARLPRGADNDFRGATAYVAATLKPAAVGSAFIAGERPVGMTEPGNIDLGKRPVVRNKDGTISTVRSITITEDNGAVLIPTVVGKKVVSNREAIDHYRKTGENLGKFRTENDADAYARNLHEEQAGRYEHGIAPIPEVNEQGERIEVRPSAYQQDTQTRIERAYWVTVPGADGKGAVRMMDAYTDQPMTHADGSRIEVPFSKMKYLAGLQHKAEVTKGHAHQATESGVAAPGGLPAAP